MFNPVSLVNDRHPLDMSHIKLSYVTAFYCNQSSINSVTQLLRKYESYPQDLIRQMEFVVVDDGSPVKYEIPNFSLNLTWLRINEDIAWNIPGARNLGVTYAKADKIIIADLDHEFPSETLQYMVNARNPGRTFYKIYRTNARKRACIFMSRARYMRHFGYDEEFAGDYGSEDIQFEKYHKSHGSKPGRFPKKYYCCKRRIDHKSEYHSLVRDTATNSLLNKRKRQEISLFGAEQGHSRIFLNFTWKMLYKNRLAPVVPRTRPLWRPLWWFRYLFSGLAH